MFCSASRIRALHFHELGNRDVAFLMGFPPLHVLVPVRSIQRVGIE